MTTFARPVRPGFVLATCCLSLLIVGIDNTIVTIALPQIRFGLGASLRAAQWTVDAYQLVLGAFLLTAGAVADRWGRRGTLQVGLGVFTVASICCALAPTVGWLIGFRVLQALGGSMMNPVAMAIVSHAHPDPRRRAHAFGIWSAVYGLSMAIGPVLGGVLVQHAGWRFVFWCTVPIGLAAIGLCARVVPESKASVARSFDVVGQALIVLVLLGVTAVIIEGGALGWSSPSIVALMIGVVGAVAALVRWEGRVAQPVVDPRFFRSATFSGALVISLVGMGAAAGYLWVITFYLQDSRGLEPAHAGVLMLPIAAMIVITAPVSGRIAGRHGPRLPLFLSGAAVSVAAVLLTALHAQTATALLMCSFVVFGAGFGLLNAPITNAAVAGMPPDRAAVASAVASTGRQVGQALGVAVIGAVVVARTDPAAVAGSLPAASHAGWWTIVAAGVVVIAVAAMTSARRHGAEPDADDRVEPDAAREGSA